MSLKISRILHAGYIFETKLARVVFDPIFETPFSVNCYSFPQVQFDTKKIKNQKFDAIFISHYHDDHCSFESLNLLDRKTPLYMYCVHDEMFELLKQMGFQHVQPLFLGEVVLIGDMEVKPIRALDADVDVMFHVRSGDLNILNVVDSWIDEAILGHLCQISWDLILWPFQLMREVEVLSPKRFDDGPASFPEEWKLQLTELKPKVIVPSSCQFRFESWSWLNENYFSFSYQMFSEQVGKLLPSTKVQKLNPGESFNLNANGRDLSDQLDWIKIIDNKNVDYVFQPGRAPHTSEISMQLGYVQAHLKERVLEFCHSDLIEKLRALIFADESYFAEARIWWLSLYDSNGEAIHFYYHLSGQNTKMVDVVDRADWKTEIPILKLYGALKNAESLSSLYIRINDVDFAPEQEQELSKADILEDPLLRCLYDRKFASYQKAQLEKYLSSNGFWC